MKYLRAISLIAASAAVSAACASSTGNHASGGTSSATGGGTASSSTTASSTGGGASSSSVSSGSSSSSGASSSSVSSSSSGGPVGTIGPTGGTLSTLSFAIVGDTRPPTEDDTGGYPTAVITKIWQDVQAFSPLPPFAIGTGDYQYANPTGTQQAPQLDLYLTARANFTNTVFPAMGNHECTGYTDSNCGQGNKDGITTNYTTFMSKMLQPLGQTLPYYTINVNGTNNAWTAKFVFVACNAWNTTQATWLGTQLATPTTYTFVVRHEGTDANTAPCVTPSGTIIAQHPLTALLVGHTHTFEYFVNTKEVVTGNGGAPLSGTLNYGYVIATQQASGQIVFNEYDYMTNTVQMSFAVNP